MDFTIYQLEPPPGGGFHFGEQGLELEESHVTFPSDSLFAALVAVIAEQEAATAVSDFVTPFAEGQSSFRLTSVFPRAGDLPLLPLPRLPIHLSVQDPNRREKLLPRKFNRRVRFVSPGICHKLCAAADMDRYLTEENGRFLQEGAVWLTAAEQKWLPPAWRTFAPAALADQLVWRGESVPRVTVDRRHNNSNVYRMGRVNFNEACGLWVGVRYANQDRKGRVESLLRHLGDRGIGGERSNGYGGFSLRTEPAYQWPEDWPDGNGHHLLLSRYLPAENEIEPALQTQPLAAYRLVTVGGWLASPGRPHLRRKQISLLAEGSVVGGVGDEGMGPVNGRMADVRPDWEDFPHPVWRCGLAFTVPATAKAPDPEMEPA